MTRQPPAERKRDTTVALPATGLGGGAQNGAITAVTRHLPARQNSDVTAVAPQPRTAAEFEALPVCGGLLQAGTVVGYRLYEIGSDWTPQV